MAVQTIAYKPPPTVRDFIKDFIPGRLFYDFIVGPYGSGKTTGLFFKLAYMAGLQEKGRDGIRRSRCVVVRNTAPMLRDTTLVSWNYWFRDGEAGKWLATDKTFILRYGDVECEVLFRPLDTPDDVRRVLSLEVTFAILDEFVEIPQEIVQALSGRVGRYPSKKDGGATNYGMWGASNPGTEDVWWFDYLHTDLPKNVRYFHQPSGTSPDAENLENLPKGYYTDLAVGKTPEWVKQFIDAEWGFSASGKPVVPSFKPDLHIAKSRLILNPNLPLVFGFDPGYAGMAAIFGQEDLHGRLMVMGEVLAQNIGAERYIQERLRPYIKANFTSAKVICEPDPAAANRAQTDEKSVVDVIRKYFPAKPETNNRLPLRLNAIEHFTGRLTDMGPALQIDPEMCPTLIRALKGGWRWEVDQKRGSVIKGETPEKNPYSHPGDAFGYLCRHYHRGAERDYRYSQANGGRPFTPPRNFGQNNYHWR